MSNLSEQTKQFPDSPGVYRFLDAKGVILYIGRATSLRKRVGQYFTKRIDARIAEMVSLARDIRYEQTDTVLEAIILEANLIKKYWPKYNVKDKDNRSFLYIVIPGRIILGRSSCAIASWRKYLAAQGACLWSLSKRYACQKRAKDHPADLSL